MNHGVQRLAGSEVSFETEVFAERALPLEDGVLGYRECGSGHQTIVLLHGISSGSASWTDCARHLMPHARVIAWDAPGYGASTPLADAAPSALDYAARLQSLLEGLQIKHCLIVGHSLGALMAAGFAGLMPGREFGFALFSPALGYGSDPQRSAQVRQQRLTSLHDLGVEGMARALPDRLLTAQADEAAREAVRRNALRLRSQGYAQAVELLSGDDIHRYALPPESTRVYCGEHDVVTPPAQSERYATQLGVPFAVIQHAGHACYIEQPQAVAECILETLAATSELNGRPS